MEKVVVAEHLKKSYRVKTDIATLFSKSSNNFIRAVDDVSFDMFGGEILGLVGESGSGKTTTGRLLVRLEEPDSGEIYVNSIKLSSLRVKELKTFYRNVQMIFQDPYESINPRFTVLETVLEPVRVQHLVPPDERNDLAASFLERSGLKPSLNYLHKFPHQLSGGERQRLSIARALVMQPKVLVADEPVSMLDVSIKAGILNLLKSLSRDFQVAILYISHDLSTVKYLCDRLIIMYLGKFMEIGYADSVIDKGKHPYTMALRAAIPIPDPSFKRARTISNNITEKSLHVIQGCRYRTECKYAMDICSKIEPVLKKIGEKHYVACHLC
jgi:oligopeptide/dipeptide ABC transporter ATP-binding protein